MSKFAYCYEADGLMWCVYPNGVHARPFPATSNKDEVNEVTKDSSNDEPDVKKV